MKSSHPTVLWRTRALAALICPDLSVAANQLTCRADSGGDRPFERAVRCASVPSQIGGCKRTRTAFVSNGRRLSLATPVIFLLKPIRIRAVGALMCRRCSGRPGLRPLAPPTSAAGTHQRNFADLLGSARPFFPSSRLQVFGLRWKRIGGPDFLNLSTGAVENEFRGSLEHLGRTSRISDRFAHFPRSDARQDSTFPRGKCGRAAAAHFPPSLRVSGTLRERLASGSLLFNSRIRSLQKFN